MELMIRKIAWFNLMLGVLFIFPVVTWSALKYFSRPSVESRFVHTPIEESIARIQEISELEKFREYAIHLEKMNVLNAQSREFQNVWIKNLILYLGISMGLASFWFFATSGSIFLALRKKHGNASAGTE